VFHLIFSHVYLILMPLAVMEGPFLAIACGIAAGLGAINPFIAYGILIGGDLGPDLLYYGIGRWGATLPFVRGYASRIKAIRDNFLSLEQLLNSHPLATMASAKLSYLVSPGLIVSAGLSGMSLRRVVMCSLAVSTLYLGALAALGYGFASVYGYLLPSFPERRRALSRNPRNRNPMRSGLRDGIDAPALAATVRCPREQPDKLRPHRSVIATALRLKGAGRTLKALLGAFA
jgi:membrane protein DedA with SNARE-associated domain